MKVNYIILNTYTGIPPLPLRLTLLELRKEEYPLATRLGIWNLLVSEYLKREILTISLSILFQLILLINHI